MRRMLLAFLTLLLFAALSPRAFADGTAVTAMTTECDVEKDGACTVTIRFTVEFAPGLERFAIPIDLAARDIVCPMAYQLRTVEGYKLLELTGPLAGKTELVLSYRLNETVTDDGQRQIFFLQLLHPAWTCPISGYTVELRLPGGFKTMPVFLSGYYGDHIDNYMEITIREGTIHALLTPQQTLQDHEAISVSLELPPDFFDLRFLAGKTLQVDRMLFLALLLMAAGYWAVFLRNPPVLPKRQAMPPEGGNAGDVPFVLTGSAPDLALMIVQWASLGYLTLTRTRTGHIRLQRQIDMDTERRRFECEIFYTLFSRGERCDVRSAEFLKARRLANERSRQFWQNRVYDPKAGSPLIFRLLAIGAGLVLCLGCFDVWVPSKSWRWLAIVPLSLLGGVACYGVQRLGGFLLRRHSLRTLFLALLSGGYLFLAGRNSGLTALMALALLAQLIVGLLLRCGGRRTKSGFALAAELLGYRRWLLAAPQETLTMSLETDPQFFYRILPFADALGVGRAVAGTLGRFRLEPCDWMIWEGKTPKTAPVFYVRYERMLAGLRGERDPDGRPRSAQAKAPQVSTRVNLPREDTGTKRQATKRPPVALDGRKGGRP